jgi:5-methyltetrahydrofolate--homocysteine methyltransferase
VETAESYGIARDDVAIDCVCLPSSVAPGSMRTTLETIAAVHSDLGVATLLGTSNAGVMMPQPEMLDLAYLIAAASYGLDVSMTNPATPLVEGMVNAIDFLMGTDMFGKGYLNWHRGTVNQGRSVEVPA